MAQKVNVILVDDIDGTEAAETVAFGLDGRTYEIDLNSKNAAKLRKQIEDYAAKARLVRSGKFGVKKAPLNNNKAVRDWAKTVGIEVSPQGRIPQHVIDAYHNR